MKRDNCGAKEITRYTKSPSEGKPSGGFCQRSQGNVISFSSRFRVSEPDYSGLTVSSATKEPLVFLKPAIHSPASLRT